MRDRLRRWGIGGRSIKIVIAVALSWELGRLIPGANEFPYFAPLAALLSMQLTIAETVSAAVNRTLGVMAGVAVALAVVQFLGVSVWSLCLVVLLSLVAGPWLRLKSAATTQVAVSAMLVLFVGEATAIGYSLLRIVETMIGAVVGVAVNAVLVPPNHVAEARDAANALIGRIAGTLGALATGLSEGLNEETAHRLLEQARALREPVNAARDAVQYAASSLEYHPRGRRIRDEVDAVERIVTVLERTAAQARSMARAVADAAGAADPERDAPLFPGEITQATAALLDALGGVLVSLERQGEWDASWAAEEALDEARRVRDALLALSHGSVPELSPGNWYTLGALLSLSERMLTDLAEALDERRRAAEPVVATAAASGTG